MRRLPLCMVVLAVLSGFGCSGAAGDGGLPRQPPDEDDAAAPVVDENPDRGTKVDGGAGLDVAVAAVDPGVAVPDARPQPDVAPILGIDCKVAMFCDDFERYTAGARPGGGWGVTAVAGATVLVDDTRSWSGKKSVRISSPSGNRPDGFINLGKPLLPLPNNKLFGRMMVFMTAVPKGPVHAASMMAEGHLPDGRSANYFYGTWAGALTPNYNPHDCSAGGAHGYPTGRWVCFQWLFDGSKRPDGTGTKDEMHFWIDSLPVSKLTVVQKGSFCIDNYRGEWTAPTFEKLHLGWLQYQASTTPIDMWIDDVAVDTQPISCPTR